MNYSQVKTLAGNFTADISLTRYSTQQYLDAINYANKEFAYDSKALYKDATTYTVVSETSTYNLPSDFWLERQVTHKGIELFAISRHTLQRSNSNDWTLDTGTPTNYIIDPEEARKQIRLYRIPQGDDAGVNLVLTYYPIPTDLSADSDVPLNSSSLMSQFHLGIAAYAATLLLLFETQTPEIALKRSQLMKIYNDKVSLATSYFGNTPSESMQLRGSRRWY